MIGGVIFVSREGNMNGSATTAIPPKNLLILVLFFYRSFVHTGILKNMRSPGSTSTSTSASITTITTTTTSTAATITTTLNQAFFFQNQKGVRRRNPSGGR